MCEFCMQHGEGKIWYLNMKNYAQELLHEELSATQQEVTGLTSRIQWKTASFASLVSMMGIPANNQPEPTPENTTTADSTPQSQKSTGEASLLLPVARPAYTERESIRRQQIEHFGQVLPIEEVEKIVDIASSITRVPCYCRLKNTGKSDHRYCFGFATDRTGILSKYPDTSLSLEVLSKEETKKILRGLDEKGLVHSIWTHITPYIGGVCNCDGDCQAIQIHQNGGPAVFFRAEYLCQVDPDQCTGCRECMGQCQFGAQMYSNTLGKVHIHAGKCVGCGVCRAACSYDAISLVPRNADPVAAQLWLNKNPA